MNKLESVIGLIAQCLAVMQPITPGGLFNYIQTFLVPDVTVGEMFTCIDWMISEGYDIRFENGEYHAEYEP